MKIFATTTTLSLTAATLLLAIMTQPQSQWMTSAESTSGSSMTSIAVDDSLPPLELPSDQKDGSHDHRFQRGDGRKGGFGVKGLGGRLQLCPTGDCTQSIIDITMHHLHEVDADGNETINKVARFGGLSYNWTTPTSTIQDGVNVTSSSFSAMLPLNGSDALVAYNASMDFYASNATKAFAGTVVEIPAGGLKFAVWIDNWPFLADSNKLRLGLRIMTRNGKGDKKPKGEREPGRRGRDKKIERLALQDSMFLDSPAVAELDGTVQNITSRIATQPEFVIVEYEFPKFKSLYYDPVISTDEPDQATADATGSKSGNVRSDALSSLQSTGGIATSLVVAVIAVFAYA